MSANYKCNTRCVHFHEPLILKTFSSVFGNFFEVVLVLEDLFSAFESLLIW